MERNIFASIIFADIVKFSDRAIDDIRRREISVTLQDIVRSSDALKGRERGEDYLAIFTGDGFALVFLDDELGSFQTGIELTPKIAQSGIPCRLGLHCGEVSIIRDLNDQVNSVGSTVNDASRVMSFGGSGHLLISKGYRDLIHRRSDKYTHLFYDIGTYQDKNGEIHHLFNIFSDSLGNPEQPRKGKVSGKNRQILSSGDSLLASDRRRKIIGRAGAIREIVQFLKKNQGMAVVTGPPGMGKTEVCRAALRKYLETGKPGGTGVFFVNLTEVKHFAGFLESVAEAYGAGSVKNPDSLAGIAVERGGVLYLDNLEDVLTEPEAKAQVLGFLDVLIQEGSPKIIASSRIELYGVSEKTIQLERLAADEAVKLFSGEWKRLDSKTAGESKIRRFVTEDLGCHPLSIILTAAQMRRYGSLERLREAWLRKGTDIARIDGAAGDERLRILDTSISFSLDVLKGLGESAMNALRLWNLMIFFPSGLAEHAWQFLQNTTSLCSDDVNLLIDNNLVENDAEKGIIRMLPPLVRFAESRALAERDGFSLEEAVKMAFPYFLAISEEYRAHKSDHRHQETLDRMFDEYPNIHRMVTLLSAFGDRFRNELGTLGLSIRAFIQAGPLIMHDTFAKIINVLRGDRNLVLARHLLQMGFFESNIGQVDRSLQCFTEALEIYREFEDEEGITDALSKIAESNLWQGRVTSAIREFTEVLEIYQRLDNKLMAVVSMFNLGTAKWRKGRVLETEKHYREALQLAREVGEEISLGQIMMRIGQVNATRGNVEEAERCYRECQQHHRKEKFTLGYGYALRFLGDLEMRMGRHEEALEHLTLSLETNRKQNVEIGIASVLVTLTQLHIMQGNLAEAERCITEGEELSTRCDNGLLLGNIRQTRAMLERAKGNLDDAAARFKTAAATAHAEEYLVGEAESLCHLGDVLMEAGRTAEAEEPLTKALEYLTLLDYKEYLALVTANLCLLKQRIGKPVNREDIDTALQHAYNSKFPWVIERVEKVAHQMDQEK